MREYTTQMDAARKGIATPQMKIVAEKRKKCSLKSLWDIWQKVKL